MISAIKISKYQKPKLHGTGIESKHVYSTMHEYSECHHCNFILSSQSVKNAISPCARALLIHWSGLITGTAAGVRRHRLGTGSELAKRWSKSSCEKQNKVSNPEFNPTASWTWSSSLYSNKYKTVKNHETKPKRWTSSNKKWSFVSTLFELILQVINTS